MTMLWAQICPFVALELYENEQTKDSLTLFLVFCFSGWILLNVLFFCTIDLSYIKTFFGTKTAPQYAVELFLTGDSDFKKFDAVFTNRLDYTKSVHEEAKRWVATNIDLWKAEEPEWFKIELIPDEVSFSLS